MTGVAEPRAGGMLARHVWANPRYTDQGLHPISLHASIRARVTGPWGYRMQATESSPIRQNVRVPWVLWGASMALALLGSAFVALNGNSIIENLTLVTIFGAMGFIGALIASRQPDNPIGWVLTSATLVIALAFVTDGYSTYATEGRIDPLPGWQWAAWVPSWAWATGLGLILTFLFLYFPNGHLPSPRWRPVAISSAVVIGVITLVGAVNPAADMGVGARNPIGIDALGQVADSIIGFAFLALVLLGALSAISLFVRFRRVRGEEREQIKWLAFSAVLVATWIALSFIGEAFDIPLLRDSGLMAVFSALAMLSIPVAVGVAMLRYRLYEIDVVIRKTVVVAVLVVFVTIVYAGIVVGIGALVAGTASDGPLPIIAAVVIAIAFQPVRARANRIANRLVLGERASPYQVLSAFSDRLTGAYASDDLLVRMATLIGEGAGVRSVTVWLRVGDEVRPAAAWPADGPGASPGPRSHGASWRGSYPSSAGLARLPSGKRVSSSAPISVGERPGEPLSHEAEQLLQHLASQAGLVLRNARLTEELRARLLELQASRQRIVTAQDERAKQLERNLHDGAQQQLVALGVQLSLARRLAERDAPEMAATLDGLQTAATDALENLRDLARGIYPPLLADQGLLVALEAQARKAALPVEVEGVGSAAIRRRWRQPCISAASRRSRTSRSTRTRRAAHVRLADLDGTVSFEVTDDGAGFDPRADAPRDRLQGMKDRLEALGGDDRGRLGPERRNDGWWGDPCAGFGLELDRV